MFYTFLNSITKLISGGPELDMSKLREQSENQEEENEEILIDMMSATF